MPIALLTLSDVLVNKGYQEAPQATFKAYNKDSKRGTINFKVSNPVYLGEGKDTQYDKYSIRWEGVEPTNLERLNVPGCRVSLFGTQVQKEFQNNKYVEITCNGFSAVRFTYGSTPKKEEATAEKELSLD